jgi:hypothetical protein
MNVGNNFILVCLLDYLTTPALLRMLAKVAGRLRIPCVKKVTNIVGPRTPSLALWGCAPEFVATPAIHKLDRWAWLEERIDW